MIETEIQEGPPASPGWDALPGLPFLLATQSGRRVLRGLGIAPAGRMLLTCPDREAALGLAGCLAAELSLDVHKLDLSKVSSLDAAGIQARLLSTWERVDAERAVYVLDGLEALSGFGAALMCRLLDSRSSSDSVVMAVAGREVMPCLAARFDVSLEAA